MLQTDLLFICKIQAFIFIFLDLSSLSDDEFFSAYVYEGRYRK